MLVLTVLTHSVSTDEYLRMCEKILILSVFLGKRINIRRFESNLDHALRQTSLKQKCTEHVMLQNRYLSHCFKYFTLSIYTGFVHTDVHVYWSISVCDKGGMLKHQLCTERWSWVEQAGIV